MTNETQLNLSDFRDMLDAFGADPRRWPPDRHAAAQLLLATNADARSMFHEARALDQVLAAGLRAPALDPTIVERVAMAAIGRTPRNSISRTPARQAASSMSNVVALGRRRIAPAAPGPERRDFVESPAIAWRAAGALAASLITGLLIGTFDIAPASVRSLASLGQSERYVDYVVTALQNDGLSTLFDEDYL